MTKFKWDARYAKFKLPYFAQWHWPGELGWKLIYRKRFRGKKQFKNGESFTVKYTVKLP